MGNDRACVYSARCHCSHLPFHGTDSAGYTMEALQHPCHYYICSQLIASHTSTLPMSWDPPPQRIKYPPNGRNKSLKQE
eukprot:340754-Amphidinium_carterae.1